MIPKKLEIEKLCLDSLSIANIAGKYNQLIDYLQAKEDPENIIKAYNDLLDRQHEGEASKGECVRCGYAQDVHDRYGCDEFVKSQPQLKEESPKEDTLKDYIETDYFLQKYIKDNFVSKEKIKREANLVGWPDCECGKSAGITERALRQLLTSLGLGD